MTLIARSVRHLVARRDDADATPRVGNLDGSPGGTLLFGAFGSALPFQRSSFRAGSESSHSRCERGYGLRRHVRLGASTIECKADMRYSSRKPSMMKVGLIPPVARMETP